jgi:hypothetical protein
VREPAVVLYGRDGCHLCDEARRGLVALRDELAPFHLREVDIESDPALLAAYLERIPVIEVGGREVCELGLDRGAVARAIADASPATH